MKKKIGILIAAIAAFSISYIFAIELYDRLPNKIEKLYEKIQLVDITYDEIGVSFSGIEYGIEETRQHLQDMNEKMVKKLTQSENIIDLYNDDEHTYLTTLKQEDTAIEISTTDNGEDWAYYFNLKNQKDIDYNTYYTLDITGNGEIEVLDALRNNGRMQLEAWDVELKESIYFKGQLEGQISKKQEERMVEQFLSNLQGSQTNYYEDDLSATTCVYYGYTPWFKESIEEIDGDKTNMQIGFKYNDELDCTEIIIAFPFYNMSF